MLAPMGIEFEMRNCFYDGHSGNGIQEETQAISKRYDLVLRNKLNFYICVKTGFAAAG